MNLNLCDSENHTEECKTRHDLEACTALINSVYWKVEKKELFFFFFSPWTSSEIESSISIEYGLQPLKHGMFNLKSLVHSLNKSSILGHVLNNA